ncbi:hypothetical protein [Saccharothrix coeruleofusca]|uniref:KAP-like P-loop domain-containing protein n=1 Tax=Saccharothrix coeruleofusca TaxID=33919 RepID=A0A918AWZ7_9PSEU|nr:hypothetical protein [Saccharothrix coeruleofusca]GGP87071.1 hypothetical protein GCM10010185_71010 [Saccharothrix coeruleofusca]
MTGNNSGPPHPVVERALERLVKREEFTDEITRLKLDPDKVVRQLLDDPTLRDNARQAYESVGHMLDDLDDQLDTRPDFWPRQWRPSRHELGALIAMVCLPTVWLVLVVQFSEWAPDIVVSSSAAVILTTAVACGLYGLPTEFLNWLAWVGGLARLLTVIPAHRWIQQRELRDEVLASHLREWLSSQQTPSFDLELQLRNADGLTLPARMGPLVTTAAVEACKREINRSMPGAVGIAGSRGAGKTTIIERAVADEFTAAHRGPMLGVMATAPVRYDARDFVLHLHARVCRAVLDFLTEPGGPVGSDTLGLWRKVHRRRAFRRAVGNWTRALAQACALALAALGYAEFTWGWTGDPAVLWHGGAHFVVHVWSNFPGALFTWDVHTYTAVVAIAFAGRAMWLLLVRVLLPIPARTARASRRIAARAGAAQRSDPRHEALRTVTEQHLRRIRFLQTHTSGWSGKVSAPLGSELELTRSSAHSEQPWTHPEVVTRFREFLELVVDVLGKEPTKLSGVVVAIDELDKISDPEEAQRFLNEIKGVFGVPHCLFLVSMSDDALTAFERRGIPARDAFDSSFTTMIHVQPFTLDESRTWLAQRALGIPMPFVWLCHCLSGGLPRDLGRTAIALHDLQAEHTRLTHVTRALLRQDLDLKIRAFTHTARHIHRTEADEPDQPQALIKDLQDAADRGTTDLADTALRMWSDQRTPMTPLEELRAEAACYLLFCQTIAEVFNDHLNPDHLTAIDGVTMLARVRRHMAVNTKLATTLLEDLRSAFHQPTDHTS